MNASTLHTSAADTLRGRTTAPAPRIHIKNILVPVDLSKLSFKSLQYAIPLAQQYGAKLTLLYVIEPLAYAPELPYGLPGPQDPAVEIRHELEELRRSSIPDELPVEIAILEDFASSGVVDAARSMCADLIVATTHGRCGLKRLLMGSTVEKIVQHAPCPVLVLSECEHEFV